MTLLKVLEISKKIESNEILKRITFTQRKFQKIAIAGETGSGKSTLLKVIAGLIQPDAGGEVWFEHKKVKGPEEKLVPGHPDIFYLTQHFELPKFLRVEQVLAYASKISDNEADNIFKICKIDHLLQRKTDQLSGGERQRIALAMLLVASPSLLLLDEPFSNLDIVHKNILRSVIHEISENLKVTCILVSHDPGDMLSWADKILILKDGKVVQQGKPAAIYERPVNEYVAGLFGQYTLLTPEEAEAFSISTNSAQKGKKIMIRPEDFSLVSDQSMQAISGKLKRKRFFGSFYELEIAVFNKIIMTQVQKCPFSAGDRVLIKVDACHVWYI